MSRMAIEKAAAPAVRPSSSAPPATRPPNETGRRPRRQRLLLVWAMFGSADQGAERLRASWRLSSALGDREPQPRFAAGEEVVADSAAGAAARL